MDIVWRSKRNPIILRVAIPSSNSIFNSAVVPFKNGFAGVFRCDDKSRQMKIHAGFSEDGIKWNIPRVCWIDDRYYITWCNGYHGYPTIGVGYTYDFNNSFSLK